MAVADRSGNTGKRLTVRRCIGQKRLQKLSINLIKEVRNDAELKAAGFQIHP